MGLQPLFVHDRRGVIERMYAIGSRQTKPAH